MRSLEGLVNPLMNKIKTFILMILTITQIMKDMYIS